MKTIFREPLLYFLLLGGVFFVLFQQVADDSYVSPDQREEIVVSAGQIQMLNLGFEKTWQRSPIREELDGLIQSYVREEVMYREALALGLDRDDPIVRRRLRQKLEFLSEDMVALAEPEDSELQTFLDANAETYRQPSRYSFRQVYISSNERGQNAESDAMELLGKLRSEEVDAAAVGDSKMLQSEFINEADYEITRTLGGEFLQALKKTETGSWQGPVRSGFGLHLIYISKQVVGEVPQLNEVRSQVFRDWSSRQRIKTNEAIYDNLRSRYKVTVEIALSENSANASLVKVAE
jgi:hypothetical protein